MGLAPAVKSSASDQLANAGQRDGREYVSTETYAEFAGTDAPRSRIERIGVCSSRPLTVPTTEETTLAEVSCSQNRRTAHPAARSVKVFRRSRALVAVSLASHQAAFALGGTACFGQLCQKQPSKNTTTRWRGKTMSPRHRSPGTTAVSTRYRRPAWWRRDRTVNSSIVSRPRFDCMQRRTPGEDAHETSRRRRVGFDGGAPEA